MSSRHPSVRLALLAFALSAWVEGSTQLRRSALIASASSFFAADEPELPPMEENDGELGSATWRGAFMEWVKAKGRKLTEWERLAFGTVDLSAAFLILNSLHSKPLLPFLLTPLLGELPVPRTVIRSPRWRYVLLTSLALTITHSLSRILVSSLITRLTKRQPLLPPGAQVLLKGTDLELQPSSPRSHSSEVSACDPTDSECLICAAPASSTNPLEAFCTLAPKLHPVHRSCFLRWRAAYANERPPELVDLRGKDGVPTEREMRRALAVLKAASARGEVLGTQLRLTAGGPQGITSELCLLPPPPYPANVETPLAVLKTSSPPCPGCRSSVLLYFVLSRHLSSPRRLTMSERARQKLREWSKVVPARAVVGQFLAQQGFVLAVVSMMRAQGGGEVYVSTGL